jgi:hypothetical protein
MYKALCHKKSESIRNWKKQHTDFNGFVLDTTTKQTNKDHGLLLGEDTDEHTDDKFADDKCDGDEDDDTDDTDSKDDDDSGTKYNDTDDDNNDDINDDDTDGKCDGIEGNNSNKCMSSIRSRDDGIRYYNMCVGFGGHLKLKQKWGLVENQHLVTNKGGSVINPGLSDPEGDTIDASHITIEQKELIGGVHKEPIGHVLGINGNFIGDKMIDDIYEFINNHGMIHREQVFTNAKHGYVSYVSTLEETVFSYSKGKTKIPAVT